MITKELDLHEKNRIKIMKEILLQLTDSFILKGGTALMFGYGLTRFSEDIDLDPIGPSINSHKKTLLNLKFSSFKDVSIQIKKDTNTTFRVMVDYNDYNLNLPKDFNKYPLKIECSFRNRFTDPTLYKNIDGMTIYNIEELISQKISAFTARNKPRDIYDIGFLLENYNHAFSYEQIRMINNVMTYKDIDSLELCLIDGLNNHTLTGITQLDPCDYVLKIEQNINKRLEKLAKST